LQVPFANRKRVRDSLGGAIVEGSSLHGSLLSVVVGAEGLQPLGTIPFLSGEPDQQIGHLYCGNSD
jgi:hypothetical protein